MRSAIGSLFVAVAAVSIGGAQPRVVVLDNVRLIDGSGAPPVERARIVVSGDRIERVGAAGAGDAPAAAETIDLAGRTVIPGLIDAHFHIEEDPKLALRQLSHGVTAFRDPGEWDAMFDPLRRMMAEDGLPGPRIFTVGPHIDGENPAYPEDSVVARDAEEARRLAQWNVDGGATAIKIYYRLPFASAQAVIGVCEARRVPCTAHLELLDAAALFAAGLHGVEHITSLGPGLLPPRAAEDYRQAVLKSNDARRHGRYAMFENLDLEGPRAQALYKVLRERRPWIDPTLAVFERRADKPLAGTKPDGARVQAAGFEGMKQLTHRVAREGARIVMGGHTDVPFAGRGEAPWREMELLVESGLTPLEAITAATSTAASFLYKSGELGRLAPGFQADLVVLSGNPAERIEAVRSVERVMVGGRWIDVNRYRAY